MRLLHGCGRGRAERQSRAGGAAAEEAARAKQLVLLSEELLPGVRALRAARDGVVHQRVVAPVNVRDHPLLENHGADAAQQHDGQHHGEGRHGVGTAPNRDIAGNPRGERKPE